MWDDTSCKVVVSRYVVFNEDLLQKGQVLLESANKTFEVYSKDRVLSVQNLRMQHLVLKLMLVRVDERELPNL